MTKVTLRSGLVALALAGVLAGCGYNQGDRAASGGLIGAGGGALISAAAGGNPAVGALAGGAAGALTGALTGPGTLDLGRPVWR